LGKNGFQTGPLSSSKRSSAPSTAIPLAKRPLLVTEEKRQLDVVSIP